MRIVVKDLVTEGKDINEVLDMPYEFLIDVLEEKANKIKKVYDEDEVERLLDQM